MTDLTALLAPPCGNETPLIVPLGQVCEGGVNCTLVASNPGATVISPVLLCLAGVTGHVWALCYLYSGTRRHNAHTVFYLLLCTLIWTDFWGKLATTPPAIISYAFGRWMGGREMCNLHGFTMILVTETTHFTVAAMAIERLLAICHGYLYERLVTASRCWYALACIWVFSLLLSLLPLFGLGEYKLQYPFTWCYANIHLCPFTPLRHRFFTIGVGAINVGCLLTIVACNVCVVGSLLRMRLSRKVPAHLCSGRRASVQRDQELQMVVLLGVITLAFTLSWAPLNFTLMCNYLWPPHTTREDHMYDLVAIRLVSFSQILDPWVYIICRVLFKSRAWSCWRRVLLEGRRWSRRGDSHSLKLKATPSEDCPASAPASRPLTGGEEERTQMNGTLTWQPPPPSPTTVPHHHHEPDGFFCDPDGVVETSSSVGGGGDSGGGAAQPKPYHHHPDGLLGEFGVAEVVGSGGGGGGGCGGEVAPSPAHSLPLAIPIPLFICEHYTVGQQQATGHPTLYSPAAPRPASCYLDHHLSLPPLPGGAWGVPRSHSWGSSGGWAVTGWSPQRSSSTKTLPVGMGGPLFTHLLPNTHTRTAARTQPIQPVQGREKGIGRETEGDR